MKKLIALAVMICVVLALPYAFAEEAPVIPCDTLRLPAIGEKLDEAAEVFSCQGITFSVYGLEQVENHLLIHAHLKNETDQEVSFKMEKTFENRTYRAEQKTAPHQSADAVFELKPILYYMTGSFTCDILLTASDYLTTEELLEETAVSYGLSTEDMTTILTNQFGETSEQEFHDLLAGMLSLQSDSEPAVLGSASVHFVLGDAAPFEMDIIQQDWEEYTAVPSDGRTTTLFSANGIGVGLRNTYLTSEVYNEIVMPLRILNNGESKVRIAFEDITVGGEAVDGVIEVMIEAGTREETNLKLPMEELADMTCTLCVYNADTGSQIFEKTPVIIHTYQ